MFEQFIIVAVQTRKGEKIVMHLTSEWIHDVMKFLFMLSENNRVAPDIQDKRFKECAETVGVFRY